MEKEMSIGELKRVSAFSVYEKNLEEKDMKKDKDSSETKDCSETKEASEIKEGSETLDGSETKEGSETMDVSETKDGSETKYGSETKEGLETKDVSETKDGSETKDDSETKDGSGTKSGSDENGPSSKNNSNAKNNESDCQVPNQEVELSNSVKKKKRKRMMLKELAKKKKRKIESPYLTKNTQSAKSLGGKKENHVKDNIERIKHRIPSEIVPELNKPFFTVFDPDSYADSRVAAATLFSLLTFPISRKNFFSDVWERRPMVLQRHRPQYNDRWFSTKELDTILRKHYLEFTTNIDLTSYVDGVRHTHNPTGRATPSIVWEFFKEGYSVRLLNPQTYSKTVWLLNSTLQEFFNSFVGANVYLTPAGSQGFSPHYDDIEAFVMQLEGNKRWKLYQSRSSEETLPRKSSPNFTDADIGDPILDVVLEPGDLLYFPRGLIHQNIYSKSFIEAEAFKKAETLPDSHSLHITLSTYQKNTWADFLEKLIPAALEIAAEDDIEFRSGLPLNYLDYTGVLHSDSNDPRRDAFMNKISSLFSKLCKYAPVDAASDQMGVDFIHDCLPPSITEREVSGTVSRTGARWRNGKVVDGIELTGDTKVKIIRYGAVRLVMERENGMLYYNMQNSRLHHEKEATGIYIRQEEAPGIEHLIKSYPNFITVNSIPIENGSTQDKICLCCNLYLQGLLLLS